MIGNKLCCNTENLFEAELLDMRKEVYRSKAWRKGRKLELAKKALFLDEAG